MPQLILINVCTITDLLKKTLDNKKKAATDTGDTL